jgi:4-hydroxybenzoate polyprenyltransferase
MKRQLAWIGALMLFGAAVVLAAGAFGWYPLEGFGGLFIAFFLAYCAIILVAQVFSALAALRAVLAKGAEQKKPARRVMLP